MRALRTKTAVLVFLLPPLLVYLAAVIEPIGHSLVLSFYAWDGITALRFVGLGNYQSMLGSDPVFWHALVNSLVYVSIALLLQLGVALLLANLLTYIRWGREIIKTLYFLPAVVSTVAIAFLFQRIYSFEPPGLIDAALNAIGLGQLATAWLSNVNTALVAVAFPEGWRFMGVYMLILYAGLLAVPRDLEDAGRVDGASEWQLFRYIRFPYMRPVWITTMVMATTYSLRGFDIPYLLTNGGPGQSTELLTTYMYKTAFASTSFGYASAIAVFIVLECGVAVALIVGLMRPGRGT